MGPRILGFLLNETYLFYYALRHGCAPVPPDFDELHKRDIIDERRATMLDALYISTEKCGIKAVYASVHLTGDVTMAFAKLDDSFHPERITEEDKQRLERWKKEVGLAPEVQPAYFYANVCIAPPHLQELKAPAGFMRRYRLKYLRHYDVWAPKPWVIPCLYPRQL